MHRYRRMPGWTAIIVLSCCGYPACAEVRRPTHAHPSGMHRARSAALRTPTQAACIGRDPPPYA
ncbi:MAG: hypothetical protein ACYCOU_08155, partial [Sulfobacillus sp.]